MTTQDATETGLVIEGAYENDRNARNRDLFKSIIRKVYGVQDVIIGHHLVYQVEDKHSDGFVYQVVEEIPSADTLIFDHKVAKVLFGDQYLVALTTLATTPVEDRDARLAQLIELHGSKQ